jgi:hypothetical protein
MVSLSDLQTSSLLNSKLKGDFQLNQRPNSRKLPKAITSKVNLKMDFLMEMDHTRLLKVIYSKEISYTGSSMEKEKLNTRTEIFSKENSSKIFETALER